MYYINCFFIYSIIGFLFEHIIYFLLGHEGDSGILYGPWTPVYGIGILIIILVSNFIFKNLHSSKLLQTLVIFIAVVVLLTTIELLGGILIEKIFKITFWDYSNFKFHIGKYIALEISLAWGLLSIFVVYIIKPLLDKLIFKIPIWLTVIFILL
ncbi:MAG: putative ABC transporter permease, partial [Lachnospiraceae bacterium]|nr:putative ABC transporter permease [Lachnospiraceae bacterium]